MTNKPKINGKYFLSALDKIQNILNRKTWNEMSNAEKEIYEIVSDCTYKAYLTKKF